MGGFESKKEAEEKELPTADIAKDATFEYMPKYVNASAPAQEFLGMSHPGAEIRDPWSIDADAPFDPMEGSQIAEDAEAKALFNETFEAGSGILGAFGIASGLDDLTNSKAGTEKRVKGGISAAGGIAGLFPATAEVAPAVAAGVAAYDVTKAGSQDLKETGVFGKNEDNSNRDAAQWSSHVGDEFGASIGFDDQGHLVKHAPDTLGKIMGAPAVLAASMVSGAMSFGAGAVDVAKDMGKSLSIDDMQKMAVELKEKEAREAVEKEERDKAFEARMKTLPEDERKKQEMMHTVQNLWGTD